jgi:dynein heavy chain
LLFQLIEIVGSVLDRPLIKDQFTGKYEAILGMLNEELVTAEV